MINNIQDLYRIDLSQIENKQADEQNPITLHYGHHYFTNSIPKDNQKHRRQPTDVTSASGVMQPLIKQQTEPLRHIDVSDEPLIGNKDSFRRKKEGSASKILSLQQIKLIQKKQKLLNKTLTATVSVERNLSSRGTPQYQICSRTNFVELGGHPARSKSKKKINLVKYLELRNTQLLQQ